MYKSLWSNSTGTVLTLRLMKPGSEVDPFIVSFIRLMGGLSMVRAQVTP